MNGIRRANAAYTESQKNYRKPITDADRYYIYTHDTIINKAVNKKSKNLFHKWFDIDSPIDGIDVPEAVENKISTFNKETNLKRVLMQNAQNMFVQGNGYLELITIDQSNIEDELPKNSELIDVCNIDPRTIKPKLVSNAEAKKIAGSKQTIIEDVLYYVQVVARNKLQLVHPSRIIHTVQYTYGDSVWGISPVDVAYRVAQSKINSDWALGEILYRFGKPFPAVTIDDATDKEIEEVFSAIGGMNPRTGFAGDSRYHFALLNPEVIRPKEFMDNFYINLAAAFEMPLMVLIGVQKGALTGSETDLTDYYNDLECMQEIIYSPVLNRIYTQLLGSWDYELFWNTLYVDKKAEAEIQKLNAETLKLLYFDMGIVDDVTARQMAREMGINIPEENTLPVEEPMDIPVVEIREPTEGELNYAKHVHDYGKKELIEQDKRVKNAKRSK